MLIVFSAVLTWKDSALIFTQRMFVVVYIITVLSIAGSFLLAKAFRDRTEKWVFGNTHILLSEPGPLRTTVARSRVSVDCISSIKLLKSGSMKNMQYASAGGRRFRLQFLSKDGAVTENSVDMVEEEAFTIAAVIARKYPAVLIEN